MKITPAPFGVGDVIRRNPIPGADQSRRLFRVVFINERGVNGGVFQAEPADDTSKHWWAGPMPKPHQFELVEKATHK